jgi:UDPglucose 6-dehydrogenase
MSAASTSASKPWFKRLDQDGLLQQEPQQANKVFAKYGRNLSGKTFALWGPAIKPNTNDLRDAPSRVLIGALLRAVAHIYAYDPVAEEEAHRVLLLDLADAPALLQYLQFASNPMEAV